MTAEEITKRIIAAATLRMLMPPTLPPDTTRSGRMHTTHGQTRVEELIDCAGLKVALEMRFCPCGVEIEVFLNGMFCARIGREYASIDPTFLRFQIQEYLDRRPHDRR